MAKECDRVGEGDERWEERHRFGQERSLLGAGVWCSEGRTITVRPYKWQISEFRRRAQICNTGRSSLEHQDRAEFTTNSTFVVDKGFALGAGSDLQKRAPFSEWVDLRIRGSRWPAQAQRLDPRLLPLMKTLANATFSHKSLDRQCRALTLTKKKSHLPPSPAGGHRNSANRYTNAPLEKAEVGRRARFRRSGESLSARCLMQAKEGKAAKFRPGHLMIGGKEPPLHLCLISDAAEALTAAQDVASHLGAGRSRKTQESQRGRGEGRKVEDEEGGAVDLRPGWEGVSRGCCQGIWGDTRCI